MGGIYLIATDIFRGLFLEPLPSKIKRAFLFMVPKPWASPQAHSSPPSCHQHLLFLQESLCPAVHFNLLFYILCILNFKLNVKSLYDLLLCLTFNCPGDPGQKGRTQIMYINLNVSNLFLKYETTVCFIMCDSVA